MKKSIFILFLACFTAAMPTALADNEKIISVEQLPGPARDFITTHFSDTKISHVKMDTELFDKNYDVFFANGNKIEFDRKGNWKDVDCKFTEVPANIVPEKIRTYVASKYPDTKIVGIDRDRRDYEVKLNNRLELKFSLKFNFIGIND